MTVDETIPPILLIGGGRMGAALLAGWRQRGLAPSVVIDPAPLAVALAAPGVRVVASSHDIPQDFAPAAIVLAVKPQVAPGVLPSYADIVGSHAPVILSIMAGRTVSGIADLLGRRAAIVRAMPNTPAAINQGFTAAFAAPTVSAAQLGLCETLLEAVGEVAWVSEEMQLDAVTAVSGGGPAYVFLLTELLEAAAVAQGLPPDLARRMARRTVSGSGALLAASVDPAADLRRAVTSPGGTTEQALRVLMASDAWPSLINQAIEAATARSRELAG